MATNKTDKVLNVPTKREQSGASSGSAERAALRPQGNVPTLRFPGFTEEWQKKRLKDFVVRVNRKNKNLETILPLTISAQFGLVDQASFFNKIVASTNLSKYYLLYKGEFAYNKSYSSDYPWGAIKRLDNYDMGALSTLYFCFCPNPEVNSDFLTHYFESSKWYSGVSEIAGEGARNHGLLNMSVSDYFNTTHFMPVDVDEQEKIARFLNLIIERIALQKKLIEDLKKLKSAIVESMLQQETESTVILSSLGRFIRGVTYSTEDITDGDGTLVMRATNITTGSPLNFKSDVVTISKRVSKEQLIATNDIVICLANGSSALIGKNSVYDGGCLSSLTIGAFCGAFRPNHSFVKWLLQTSQYRTNVARSIQGGNGAIANLSPSDILTMKFALPNNDVLNMYDNLLNKIDDKLVTETKLLDDILSQKCYLLSAMFI